MEMNEQAVLAALILAFTLFLVVAVILIILIIAHESLVHCTSKHTFYSRAIVRRDEDGSWIEYLDGIDEASERLEDYEDREIVKVFISRM